MRDLGALQRRFYELVTAGEGALEPGLLGRGHHLDVYAEMYVARLHDVLADDFPKLRAALGEDAFRELAAGYVRACPPASFTVRELGCRLAGHLAGPTAEPPPWAAALAALEWARVEVFDAAEHAPLARAELAELPLEAFPALELRLVPASRVVRLDWTIDELWRALEEGRAPPAPRREPRVVLAWRRDVEVVHRTLDPDEAALAGALAAGATLAEVSARLAETTAGAPDQRMAELLARWVDAAVLARPRTR